MIDVALACSGCIEPIPMTAAQLVGLSVGVTAMLAIVAAVMWAFAR